MKLLKLIDENGEVIFESKIKKLISEAKRCDDVIVYVNENDEIEECYLYHYFELGEPYFIKIEEII